MSEDKLNISPTRSALIQIKNKKKLAIKGHGLLKKKQDFLINEFFELIKEYSKFKSNILDDVKRVYNCLSLDIAYSGIFVARSVSYASEKSFELTDKKKNIMGVKIPELNVKIIPTEQKTYENSPLLNKAKKEFQVLFVQLIKLASYKLALKKLSFEIKKLKRKVNSLENVQIPKLANTEKYIIFTLAEQERETFTRLKIIKRKIEAKQ